MVLLFLAAVSLAASLSAVLALVASQLRQRSSLQQEEAPKDNGTYAAVRTPERHGSDERKASVRGSPIYVGVLLVAGILYAIYSREGLGNSKQRTCTVAPSADTRLKLFGTDLHGFHHEIHTPSGKAQALFDQGLLLSWNFDQPEALAAFQLSAEADANASMAQWGIQYSVGPGANRAVLRHRPMYPAFAPDNFPTVFGAAREALRLAEAAHAKHPESKAAARDLAYAKAALIRWPEGSEVGTSRDAAEMAYARALTAYGEEHSDAAALAMAAEAIMNLHPWDYYTEKGELKETSKEAERLILAALNLDINSPLANHLLIHISEASSPLTESPLSATRGLTAANRMAFGQGPWHDKQGHLLHMPSHTFVRTGKYHEAVAANIRAYNADLFFAQNCMFPYEPEHNTDMLIFAASMAGEMKIAEEFALKIRSYVPTMVLQQPEIVTSNWAKYPLLLAHYARWSEVMKLEAPGPLDRANCPGGGYEFAQTVWRYVRTLAVVARAEGARLAGDEQEFNKLDGYLDDYLQLLKDAESKVMPEEPVFPPAVYMCEHKGLAQIYVLIVEGRMAFLRRRNKEAIDKLKAAVAIEDSFAYMEPPRVYQPVRQCLGYVLLQDGQLKEAEQVYKSDLAVYPQNGWSLHGLLAALHEQRRDLEVDALRERLTAAWRHADTAVTSSCLVFSIPWGAPRA